MTKVAGRVLAAAWMVGCLGSVGRAEGRDEGPGDFRGLVKITASGGLCPYGPCTSEVVIEKSGAYAWSEGNTAGSKTKRRGRLKAKELAKLTALIRSADFKKIKAQKFTGTCPTAYDGQETTYVFSSPRGIETIASCAYVVDGSSPLFKLTNELSSKIKSGD